MQFRQRLKTGVEFLHDSFALTKDQPLLYVYWLALALCAFCVVFIIEPHLEQGTLLKIVYAIVVSCIQACIVWHTYQYLQGQQPSLPEVVHDIRPVIPMVCLWTIAYEAVLTFLLLLQNFIVTQTQEYERTAWFTFCIRSVLSLVGVGLLFVTVYVLTALVIDRMNVLRAVRQSWRVVQATWVELLAGIGITLSLAFLALLPTAVYHLAGWHHAGVLFVIKCFAIALTIYLQILITVFVTSLYSWYINKPLPQIISY